MADPQPEAPAPAPSRWRELSQDPEERARQRASVAGETSGLIEMLDGVFQTIPPATPLAEWERKAIELPLQETLYKYGANVDPAITLAITLGGIFLMRWQAGKQIEAEKKTEKTGEALRA